MLLGPVLYYLNIAPAIALSKPFRLHIDRLLLEPLENDGFEGLLLTESWLNGLQRLLFRVVDNSVLEAGLFMSTVACKLLEESKVLGDKPLNIGLSIPMKCKDMMLHTSADV